MKYSCEVIRDLLPLYADGVCSEESAGIVKEHLEECEECRKYYEELNEENPAENSLESEKEMRKADFFRTMKKKMMKKQVYAGIAGVFLIVCILFGGVSWLKSRANTVKYEDNISVYMKDGDLTGRLEGGSYTQIQIKRVTVNEEDYLFFSTYNTEWDELTKRSGVYSEFLLSSADKGADSIERVYYFTGDDTDIEEKNAEELNQVIEQSVLLWNRD